MKVHANQEIDNITEDLQHKIDFKTKPIGSLGKLEKIALQIGSIQKTLKPEFKNPVIVVFAGDHGIVAEGVSPFPQEVTYQMVYNFLNGGAAINVFSKQHGIEVKVVDAGVNFDFDNHPALIHAKIANGTANYLQSPAMTKEQCEKAIHVGGDIVQNIYNGGSNVIGFGEMGIGNTSSASLIMSLVCNISLEKCIGRGTGLDDKGLEKKYSILEKAMQKHAGFEKNAFNILQLFGGFEIAMMCGAYLKAAELEMVIMVDGFIATSALLIASSIEKSVLTYCIFSHQSNESGHKLMLEFLQADPILNLGMRLGEGTGIAVAYPILNSALKFVNEMASFESAGVNNKVV